MKTKAGQRFIRTYSGRHYFPHEPQSKDVSIVDIAHHLSMLCRFTGAVRAFYSVAEHSYHVSFMVPPRHALSALLHDAAEAYVNDLSKPVKRFLPSYNRLEAKNWHAIATHFRLPHELDASIKTADRTMLVTEDRILMPPWDDNDPGKITGVAAMASLPCWGPETAKMKFLQRFNELMRYRRYGR